MQNFKDSEASYRQAVKVFEQHAKTSDIDVANVAEAYYRLGEIVYKKFEDVKLTGRNLKEVQAAMKSKSAYLTEAGPFFLKSVEFEVVEWTMRALYMIGRGFYDYADAFANQPIFGNKDEQMGTRLLILRDQIHPLYDRAMQAFNQNITWAKEQNIGGEYVEMSMQGVMEMAYKKGAVLEEAIQIFMSIQPPPGSSEEDKEMFMLVVEEENIQPLRERSMAIYEAGMKIAQQIGIGPSEWVDKIRDRLRELNPDSEMISARWEQWKPTERAKQYDEDGNEIIPRGRDPEYDRSIRRIQSILSMDIPVAEKIKQLNRMQMEAERAAKFEQERIDELRAKAGS
jgi:hypothetical protein